jgi:hypothetical protein
MCLTNTYLWDKGKGHPVTIHEGPGGGVEVQLSSFLEPQRLIGTGLSPGPFWMVAENLAPTGIQVATLTELCWLVVVCGR